MEYGGQDGGNGNSQIYSGQTGWNTGDRTVGMGTVTYTAGRRDGIRGTGRWEWEQSDIQRADWMEYGGQGGGNGNSHIYSGQTGWNTGDRTVGMGTVRYTAGRRDGIRGTGRWEWEQSDIQRADGMEYGGQGGGNGNSQIYSGQTGWNTGDRAVGMGTVRCMTGRRDGIQGTGRWKWEQSHIQWADGMEYGGQDGGNGNSQIISGQTGWNTGDRAVGMGAVTYTVGRLDGIRGTWRWEWEQFVCSAWYCSLPCPVLQTESSEGFCCHCTT